MTQVLEAVYDLHSRGIVHRDLKPENLLFYDNQASSKLLVVDFGLSEYEEELNKDSPVCGTATYLAPEVIAQTDSSRAQDLWSCGVISYIMLCGYPPFFKDSGDRSETRLLRKIVRGKYKFHDNFWSHVSEDAKHFVSRLMCADPRLRLTVEEALVHPWIIKNQSWNYKDSWLCILIQSLMYILIFTAVLSLYFIMLTGYFDMQDHLLSRLFQTKDVALNICHSIVSGLETVCTSSLFKLSSIFTFNS